MIFLIGGAPRCGKTTIAKKLSKKLSVSWISADTIEGMVKVSTSGEKRDKLFPKNVIRRKTRQSNDIMYSRYSATEIKNVYIKQAKSSWKAIFAMVEQEVKEGNSFIIEGHQVHPKLMSLLTTKFGKENIRPLVVTRFNTNTIVDGCLMHKAKNDWFIQKTNNKEIFYKIAEMIKSYSKFFDKDAKKYNIHTINVDIDFLSQINKIVKLFQEGIY